MHEIKFFHLWRRRFEGRICLATRRPRVFFSAESCWKVREFFQGKSLTQSRYCPRYRY